MFSHRGKPPIVRYQASNPFVCDKELSRMADKKALAPKKAMHFRASSTSLYTEDIDGSRPKSFRRIRKGYSYLGNDDIVGSKPNYAQKFEKRHPVIPSSMPEAVDNGASLVFFGPKIPEKKFVKDSLNRDDIEGAKTKIRPPKSARDLMKINDIEGTRPSIPYLQKEDRKDNSNIDYRDVTRKKAHVRRFSTNPL